jgi:hypothetical protein
MYPQTWDNEGKIDQIRTVESNGRFWLDKMCLLYKTESLRKLTPEEVQSYLHPNIERDDDTDDLVEITKGIYGKSLDVWFKVSPYTHTSRGHPGVPATYSEELGYVEAAIRTLEECKVGLMEQAFPKLKEVRSEQERYWDGIYPGCK